MVARFFVVASVVAASCGAPPEAAPPPGPELSPEAVAGWKMVDLSHGYGENTLYWPTDTRGFQLDTLAEGMTPAGFFYAMKEFATAEHGGTHLDAPYHFYEGADLVGQIPLSRLIAPGVVVDVSGPAEADPDYRASADDVRNWEAEHTARSLPGRPCSSAPAGRAAGRMRSRTWATTKPVAPTTSTFRGWQRTPCRLLADPRGWPRS